MFSLIETVQWYCCLAHVTCYQLIAAFLLFVVALIACCAIAACFTGTIAKAIAVLQLTLLPAPQCCLLLVVTIVSKQSLTPLVAVMLKQWQFLQSFLPQLIVAFINKLLLLLQLPWLATLVPITKLVLYLKWHHQCFYNLHCCQFVDLLLLHQKSTFALLQFHHCLLHWHWFHGHCWFFSCHHCSMHWCHCQSHHCFHNSHHHQIIVASVATSTK